MDLEEVNKQIEKIVAEWISKILPELKKKAPKETSELKNSLIAKFAQDRNILSSKIVISYALQGKFQDLKFWRFSKQPPVEALKEWVLRTGLNSFPYVPGYETANRMPVADKAAERIAWGIAKKWKTTGRVTRKNQWRPMRTIFSDLPDLRIKVRDTLTDEVLKMIEQSLKS